MDHPPPQALRHRIWYGDLFPTHGIDPPPRGCHIPPPPQLHRPPNFLPPHPPPMQLFQEAPHPISPRFNFSPPRHLMSGSRFYETDLNETRSRFLRDPLMPPDALSPRKNSHLRGFMEGFQPSGVYANDWRFDSSSDRHADVNRYRSVYGWGPDLNEEGVFDDRRRFFGDEGNFNLYTGKNLYGNRFRRVGALVPYRYEQSGFGGSFSNGPFRELYSKSDEDNRNFGAHYRENLSYNERQSIDLKFGGVRGLDQDIFAESWNSRTLYSSSNMRNHRLCMQGSDERQRDHDFNDCHQRSYIPMEFNNRKRVCSPIEKGWMKVESSYQRCKDSHVRSTKRQRLKNIDHVNVNQFRECFSGDHELDNLKQKKKEKYFRVETKEGSKRRSIKKRGATMTGLKTKLSSKVVKPTMTQTDADAAGSSETPNINDLHSLGQARSREELQCENSLCGKSLESINDQSDAQVLNLWRDRSSGDVQVDSSEAACLLDNSHCLLETLPDTAEDASNSSILIIDGVGCLAHVDSSADQGTDHFTDFGINLGSDNFPQNTPSECMGNGKGDERADSYSNKQVVLEDFTIGESPKIISSLDDPDIPDSGSDNVSQTHESAALGVNVEDIRKFGCPDSGSLVGSSGKEHTNEPEKETNPGQDHPPDEMPESVNSFEVSLGNAASDHLKSVCPHEIEKVAKNISFESGKVSSNEKRSLACSQFQPRQSLKYRSYASKCHLPHAMKARTWHRNSNSSDLTIETKLQHSSLSNAQNTTENGHCLYMRKGNSLVRKPHLSRDSPSVIYGPVGKLTSCVTEVFQTSDKSHSANTSLSSRPVNCQSGVPILDANCPGNGLTSQKTEASKEGAKVISRFLKRNVDALDNKLEHTDTPEEDNSGKEMRYIKRKRYQLVAALTPAGSSAFNQMKSKSRVSDGYYKSKDNQLVRGSFELHPKKEEAAITSTDVSACATLTRPSTKRIIALSKAIKYSMGSFVWKLHDKQSPSKHKRVVGTHKFLPHFLRWKKNRYWRTCKRAVYLRENSNPVPSTSKKSQALRKRGTTYIRSPHGYSLRMSRVQSISKSGLKWTSTCERNSESSSEGNLLAATTFDEHRSGEKIAATSMSSIISREQTFLIGTERYKMDPTRRTLHRIAAEQESSLSGVQSQKNVKLPCIPMGLLSCEKYVRNGKGNQLVRDPKKRTRVLASEKIRWSLHTARLRLARKKKYCQFFTKYGKCNKDDGKCPYIHDPSKIVVCTKFLSGSCSNPDCKLTHEVIPERMQDCSYFQKGLCLKDGCPYRHVNLNPNSSVCESFLRGYCAAGNECPKKHTYVCPAFEATGSCPQASACKLHHPKKKAEKTATFTDANAARGRYFDSELVDAAAAASSSYLPSEGKVDVSFRNGKFPDYISLDVNDDEDSHNLDPATRSGYDTPDFSE